MKRVIIIVLGILILISCEKSKKEFSVTELEYADYVKVVKRADWGWLPLEKGKEEATINKITIHHGGVKFTADKDPIESIKNLQKWSRAEKDWIDIPYHFMIDLAGNIYEARPINYPGDTNTEYNPTGHALVEIMGNYEVQTLSDVQQKSLVEIVAYLAKEFSVPLSEIKTHKDYSETTLCPGKDIYKYFQDSSFVKRVEMKLNESD
ncbi:MAG: peptidoglycan recognition protein family protein [Melioribacteraceae bacterium]|nr:peptidoglycan recognition protein family protein [Melioribacteraceae bacterium]